MRRIASPSSSLQRAVFRLGFCGLASLCAASLCGGCGSKSASQTAAPSRVDNEVQAVSNNPGASAADKQKAIDKINSDPKLAPSEKQNALRGLR